MYGQFERSKKMNYNYKVEIELNDDKIREDVVELDGVKRVHEWVKENFRNNGFIDMSENDNVIVFCDNNNKNDYADFLRIISGMYDDDFFRSHLKKCWWYNYEYADEDDLKSGRTYHLEDIVYEKEQFKKRWG